MADFNPKLEKIANDEVAQINHVDNDAWISFVDGFSNFCGVGRGVTLKLPQGDKILQAICCEFKATNNKAEYEVLKCKIDLDKRLGGKSIKYLQRLVTNS